MTPDFAPAIGGIQLLIHRLVRHWSGNDVAVLTLDAPGATQFDRAQGLRVHRVRAPLGHRGTIALLNCRAVIEGRRFRPQAVLSAHIVTSPGAWLIRRTVGAPFVQYLYAQEVVERPQLTSFAVRSAAAVVAISRHTETLARARGAPPQNIHRIPVGVDLPPRVEPHPGSRPTVITVARLRDRYKGHDVLMEAMPLIRAHVSNVCWVIVGDGPLRALYERQVRARGLSGHVQFVGSISDRERDAWLERAHVFAMPSRMPSHGGGEGFGIVYLEAGAHGLPVVAGNLGGALDAVIDGVTGVLVDPVDSNAVAAAIVRLLQDRDYASALGRAGAAHARNFGWARMAEAVDSVFSHVVERAG